MRHYYNCEVNASVLGMNGTFEEKPLPLTLGKAANSCFVNPNTLKKNQRAMNCWHNLLQCAKLTF